MPFDTDRLIERVDLVQLAQRAGAKLRKQGAQMRGACPLHGGDNPTGFSIYTPRDSQRPMWFCHKCGAGDAIRFVERWRNLSFVEAVKFLADEFGVPLADIGLTPAAVEEHQARRRRSDVLDLAARFYFRQLKASESARAYAAGRGFDAHTIVRLGFSNGAGLRPWLESQQADLALARECGLLRAADGLDFTANQDGQAASPEGWLVYIHRNGGHVEYLSARALAPVDPKDKSRNLPGAKQIYRAERRGDPAVVLVEGQACAETLRQIGLSSWALCGASLSDGDVLALRRRPAVYLGLDDDTHQAGTDEQQAERERTTGQRRRKLASLLGPLTVIPPHLPDEVKDFNDWLQAELRAGRDLMGQEVQHWLDQGRPWLAMRIGEAAGAGDLDQGQHIQDVAHLLAMLPAQLQPRWYKRAGRALEMTPAELRAANGAHANGDHSAAEIKDGCLCLYGQPLITAAPLIVGQETVNDGTNPPVVRYRITGRLSNGQPLRELSVPASEFENLGWLSDWGARVIKLVSRGSHWQIARAVQEISTGKESSLTEEYVYAHTGWTEINGERSFLTSTGRLAASGLDTGTKIDVGENNMRHALPAPPDGQALRLAVRASLDFLGVGPRHLTAPLWAAMFAAPFSSLPGLSLDTIIWIYGSSGSGKSSLAHTALCHFGDSFIAPRKFFPQIGWNATAFAIETAMFACKDVPLVIDDYAPQFMSVGDRDRLRRTANDVIRSLGNRQARARGPMRNGEAINRPLRNPRGLVISTAENPIEGQSLVNRMLYVPVEKNEVLRAEGNEPFDRAQEHGAGGLYAGAMSAYLRWLIANWDAALARFKADLNDGARLARATLPSGFDRLPDYYGILAAAQRLALGAFADMGVISAALAEGESADNAEAILGVVARQVGRVAEQSPARMFLEAVASLLLRRQIYLAPRVEMTPPFVPPERADLVGWFDPKDPGAVWLDTNAALSWAKLYYTKLDVNLDTTRDALNRLLVQAGLLRAVDEKTGQTTVSKWMAGSNRRVLEIDVARVEQEYEFSLRYPLKDRGEPAQPPVDLESL